MDFEEVRAYQPGDDVRHIDWRVMARTGRVYSKVFSEERERPVWLMVDAGPGMQFGTRGAFKSVVAARVAALLAWGAHTAGDRVGGLVVSPERLQLFEPRAREQHLLCLLASLSRATVVQGRESAATTARCLDRIRERVGVGDRTFVISDFADLDEAAQGHLSALAAQRADVTCVAIHDVLEEKAPPPGRYRVSDGGEVRAIDAGSARWRRAWADRFEARRAALRDFCGKHGIGLVAIRTDDDPVAALGAALRRRRPARRTRGEA